MVAGLCGPTFNEKLPECDFPAENLFILSGRDTEGERWKLLLTGVLKKNKKEKLNNKPQASEATEQTCWCVRPPAG